MVRFPSQRPIDGGTDGVGKCAQFAGAMHGRMCHEHALDQFKADVRQTYDENRAIARRTGLVRRHLEAREDSPQYGLLLRRVIVQRGAHQPVAGLEMTPSGGMLADVRMRLGQGEIQGYRLPRILCGVESGRQGLG